MEVSLNEGKWSADQIYRHIEGLPADGEGEDFTFNYYQWCAFFFFMQVLIMQVLIPYPGPPLHDPPYHMGFT